MSDEDKEFIDVESVSKITNIVFISCNHHRCDRIIITMIMAISE